eukprot:TsM_001248000 transcript=TsM_001248000 gene=TsM_001248000
MLYCGELKQCNDIKRVCVAPTIDEESRKGTKMAKWAMRWAEIHWKFPVRVRVLLGALVNNRKQITFGFFGSARFSSNHGVVSPLCWPRTQSSQPWNSTVAFGERVVNACLHRSVRGVERRQRN